MATVQFDFWQTCKFTNTPSYPKVEASRAPPRRQEAVSGLELEVPNPSRSGSGMKSSELLAQLAPESSLAGLLSVALLEIEGSSSAAGAGSADSVDVIVIANEEGLAVWEGRHGRAMRRESTRWSQVRFVMVSMHSKDQNTIAVATFRLELEVPAVTLQATGFLIRALRELVRVIEERVDESFGPGRNRALRFLDGPAEGERYGVGGPLPQVILASALGETGGHYRIAGATPLGWNFRWRDDVTELDGRSGGREGGCR
jgi:hypothetical protein